jgi:hypothetical protein
VILPEDMFRMYWDTLLLVLTLWCAAAALLGAHPAHICTGTGAHQVPTDVLPRREGCAAQGAAGRSAGAGLPAACKLGLTQPR